MIEQTKRAAEAAPRSRRSTILRRSGDLPLFEIAAHSDQRGFEVLALRVAAVAEFNLNNMRKLGEEFVVVRARRLREFEQKSVALRDQTTELRLAFETGRSGPLALGMDRL